MSQEEWRTSAKQALLRAGANDLSASEAVEKIAAAVTLLGRSKPQRRASPAAIAKLESLSKALDAASAALNALDPEAHLLLRLEAAAEIRGSLFARGPKHPHARDISDRLFNLTPLKALEMPLASGVATGLMIRPYAASLSGDLEIMSAVARDAANSNKASPGAKKGAGSDCLDACISAWLDATGALPPSTTDPLTGKASAPLFEIIRSAFEAFQIPQAARRGTDSTAIRNAIGRAKIQKDRREQGVLLALQTTELEENALKKKQYRRRGALTTTAKVRNSRKKQ